MMLFRNVCTSDLDALHHLAQKSGIGLTTLPKDKKVLLQRIEWAVASQQKKVLQLGNEYYLFVLEDPQTKKIIGSAAIEAQTGYDVPFYSYKVSKHTKISRDLGIRNDYQVLNLVNDNQGHSELCTLYLMPEYRKNNNGLLLSKARFLFMAHYSNRFAPTVIADLRGISNEQGLSPFWEHIGAHFFHMSFAEADRLTLATNKQFIADLMPRNPIYVQLLPKEVQTIIGVPHPSALPAMTLLVQEGFSYNNYVDIFDAGPTIEAPLKSIKTLAYCRIMTIDTICDVISNHDFLLSNNQLEFKATLSSALLNHENNTCSISKETAKLLEVECGDSMRIAPLHPHQSLTFL